MENEESPRRRFVTLSVDEAELEEWWDLAGSPVFGGQHIRALILDFAKKYKDQLALGANGELLGPEAKRRALLRKLSKRRHAVAELAQLLVGARSEEAAEEIAALCSEHGIELEEVMDKSRSVHVYFGTDVKTQANEADLFLIELFEEANPIPANVVFEVG